MSNLIRLQMLCQSRVQLAQLHQSGTTQGVFSGDGWTVCRPRRLHACKWPAQAQPVWWESSGSCSSCSSRLPFSVQMEKAACLQVASAAAPNPADAVSPCLSFTMECAQAEKAACLQLASAGAASLVEKQRELQQLQQSLTTQRAQLQGLLTARAERAADQVCVPVFMVMLMLSCHLRCTAW